MNKFYFHGSDDFLPKGVSLINCVDYLCKWGSAGFYRGLERHRPEQNIPHSESVFMVKELEDLEYCGGGEEYTFIVMPKGKVYKHDMHWSTLVTQLLDNGSDIDSDEVREAAHNYWSGTPSENPAWEYVCEKAVILRVFDFECDLDEIQSEKMKLESLYREEKNSDVNFSPAD